MKKNKPKIIILSTFFIILFQTITPSFAFTEDLCILENNHNHNNNENLLRDCIVMPDNCKSDQLSFSDKLKCKFISLSEILTTQNRMENRRLMMGRSLLHFDSTYYLAQMIGYPSNEAYQIALYDQVADTGSYTPFDQKGYSILTEQELNACDENRESSKKCLLTSPPLKGIARTNLVSGGVLLHVGARSTDQPTPPTSYPTNYLDTPELEKTLIDLKEWTYEKKSALCVAGITDKNHLCPSPQLNTKIYGYIPFLITGRVKYLELNATLEDLMINYNIDDKENIIPSSITYSSQINDYVKPHNGTYAKLGIFLHALQDRYSHHQCYDSSYYTKDDSSSNYQAFFNLSYG